MSEAEDKKARKSSIAVEQELRDINERRLAKAFGKGEPAPDVPGAEEVDAIRARHKSDSRPTVLMSDGIREMHTDRATLLRLLDTAREELREVREAAGPFVFRCLDQGDWSDEDRWPDRELVQASYLIGDHRRLAAALKKQPHD